MWVVILGHLASLPCQLVCQLSQWFLASRQLLLFPDCSFPSPDNDSFSSFLAILEGPPIYKRHLAIILCITKPEMIATAEETIGTLILSGPAFSVVRQARGGPQRPGCQKSRLTSTDWNELGMSHYIHKSIPHAKFEADSSSSFGDMTSQNFTRKKGTVIEFSYLPPENEFNV